jgi:hypothetical protein
MIDCTSVNGIVHGLALLVLKISNAYKTKHEPR